VRVEAENFIAQVVIKSAHDLMTMMSTATPSATPRMEINCDDRNKVRWAADNAARGKSQTAIETSAEA